MIPINHPEITKYLFQLASRYDETVLKEMENYGHRHHFPIIDRLVGAMVHLLALTVGARRVFELGSGFGYSAYWFAKAAGPEGKVWCTDGDLENKKRARNFLARAGLWEQVEFLVGDALSQLKETPGQFDIIYNDIDKDGYPDAWEAARKRIRPGGLYICDNTLWSGRVAEIKATNDPETELTAAIRKHNEKVYASQDFDVSLIPLRDGVLVARKRE